MVSQTQEKLSWEEAMQAAGDTAPETHLKEGEVLHAPSDTDASPFAARVSSLRFKGYVEYWDTKTGASNLGPSNFMWQVAKMKHPDGSQMYTRKDPHIAPDYGQDLSCPFNPESPDYHLLKGRGFKLCGKEHIPNQVAVDGHVLHSHKRGHTSLKEERAHREREEDRELQREGLKSNQELIKAAMNPSQSAPVATATAPAKAPTRARNGVKPFKCASGCDKTIKNQKMHDRHSHPEE